MPAGRVTVESLRVAVAMPSSCSFWGWWRLKSRPEGLSATLVVALEEIVGLNSRALQPLTSIGLPSASVKGTVFSSLLPCHVVTVPPKFSGSVQELGMVMKGASEGSTGQPALLPRQLPGLGSSEGFATPPWRRTSCRSSEGFPQRSNATSEILYFVSSSTLPAVRRKSPESPP